MAYIKKEVIGVASKLRISVYYLLQRPTTVNVEFQIHYEIIIESTLEEQSNNKNYVDTSQCQINSSAPVIYIINFNENV